MPVYSLPVGRKEVEVCGDGNCFYRSVALALNGKSDENFGHIREMCNELMMANPGYISTLLISTRIDGKASGAKYYVRYVGGNRGYLCLCDGLAA